jgi:dUTP pyrophosphatase
MNDPHEQPLTLALKSIPHEGAPSRLPTRATEGSAGLDLYAAVAQPVTIAPRALARIPSGVAVGLPGPGYVGLVFARSGLAVKHGVALSNGVGVIDSDYTGEVVVGLCNLGDAPYTIEPGERIAQLVVLPLPALRLVQTDSLGQTERAAGGFGSTGKF